MIADITFNSNTLFSIINLAVTILGFTYLYLVHVAKMEVKVDTMWYFQLRRGMTELEHKGLGRTNSPLRLTTKANKVIAPIVPELREFYKQINGERLGVIDLAVSVEKHFGSKLSKIICPQIPISDGACLVLAIGQLRPLESAELE